MDRNRRPRRHIPVLTMVNLYVLHDMAELKPTNHTRFELLCAP